MARLCTTAVPRSSALRHRGDLLCLRRLRPFADRGPERQRHDWRRRRCNAVRSGIAVKLNSKWARAAAELLQVGDTFDEQIEIEPVSPLPFRMTRNTTYRVVVADLLRAWEVRGETGDGWLRIRYDLEPVAAGTRFTRTSTFELRGPGVLPMPFLRRRMAIRAMILRGDRTFGPLVTGDQSGLFASAGNHEAVSFATALFASVLKEHG